MKPMNLDILNGSIGLGVTNGIQICIIEFIRYLFPFQDG